MTAEIHMDYDVVEALADQFDIAADTLHDMDRALETAIALLHASAFVGFVGNLALAHYLDGIQPAVTRLAATCNELSADLIGAIQALRDGDLSGSQRFTGTGGVGLAAGGAAGGIFSGAGSTAAEPTLEPGFAVPVGNYQDGVDGWQLIDMHGEFTPGELVVQDGPSCTIYGAMNLLVANGYDISQAEADQIYQEQKDNAAWFSRVWFDMLDGSHDEEGFPRSDALEVLDQYGANYDHGNFDTGIFGLGSPDRDAAEQFLVEQVRNGNPVYVATATDDTFGVKGKGHAYTVLGVQQDDDGNLVSVLVSTNWPHGGHIYEIPANTFMDDWIDYKDGEYIVITGEK